MKDMYITNPSEIEKKSMDIIRAELAQRRQASGADEQLRSEQEELVLARVIHTSADFDYNENLFFTNDAARAGIAALEKGATVITDTNMGLAGINKKVLQAYGGEAVCFMADEDVAQEAKSTGHTRAMAAIDKAARLYEDPIFVVGNAPTALIRLVELIEQHRVVPQLIVGVPVGFVNVVESKELLFDLDTPCIIARGNKGGSNIAASIINALLYQGSKGRNS